MRSQTTYICVLSEEAKVEQTFSFNSKLHTCMFAGGCKQRANYSDFYTYPVVILSSRLLCWCLARKVLKKSKRTKALASVPDGVTVGPTSRAHYVWPWDSIRQAAGSVAPLAWGCASHSGSLFTVKELLNVILPHHTI